TGVPLPPDAPRLSSPERSRDETEQTEERRQFSASDRESVRGRRSLEQVNRARDAADSDRRRQRDPGRDMKVKDLLNEKHRRLIRRVRDRDRRVREHRGRDDRERKKGFAHDDYSVIRGSNVHNDNVRNTASNDTMNQIQNRAIA